MIKGSIAYSNQLNEGIRKFYDGLTETLTIISEGFNKHKLERLTPADKMIKGIEDREKLLTELFVKEVSDTTKGYGIEKAKILVSIPGHIGRIANNIKSINECTKIKIRKELLFSDKAAKDLNYLFRNSIELLKCEKDLLITNNSVLIKHIEDEGEKILNKISDFDSEHGERMIKSLCNPRNSPIYLDYLDAFREIGWHTREISRKVSLI